MGVGNIIGDALAYPFNNIKALVLYVVLAIIAGIIGGATLLSSAASFSSQGFAGFAFSGLSIVGIIIFIRNYYFHFRSFPQRLDYDHNQHNFSHRICFS